MYFSQPAPTRISSSAPVSLVPQLPPSSAVTSSARPESYVLNRRINTVADVWHEYELGLDGCPSV
ncbi:hypothetical protein BCR42DRAFT_422080 [Absidia repens]|uniref:Transcription activator GCR1-like domain-containing protein n=1 Tax=Absidia repens TaxID=90262 RepID=A0A1X2I753_9FUNG|nr:hypothetical protein BCR42DRAFT_422080 [Absidia repens]